MCIETKNNFEVNKYYRTPHKALLLPLATAVKRVPVVWSRKCIASQCRQCNVHSNTTV